MLYESLRYHADISMNALLEKDGYEEHETMILKMAVTLPYQLYADGYQKVEGDFEYEGKFYSLIKQKLERDTLYVVCINNIYKTNLEASMTGFERIINNWPDSSEKSSRLLLSFTKDYFLETTKDLCHIEDWSKQVAYSFEFSKTIEGSYFLSTPPPEIFV